MTSLLSRVLTQALIFAIIPLATVTAPAAETFQLSSKRDSTVVTTITAKVEAKGKINIVAEGQTHSLPLKLSASMDYDERLLENTGQRTRLVRFYRQAEADIRVGEGQSTKRLNSARSRVAIETRGAQRELLAASGLLTREELDLLQFPGSLPLESLLPAAPVKIGEPWKPSADVLAQFLAIDAVGNGEVQAVLAEIQESGLAKIVVMGHVEGAIEGVSTEIDLEGEGLFDPKAGAFRTFALKIKENRTVGHVGPGLDVECQVTLRFAKNAKDESGLTRQTPAWEKLPRQLAYAAPSGRVRLEHGRNWHVVQEDEQTLVMRMVDRGELIAQCNISLPANPDAKDRPTLDKYSAEVQKVLGERFGKFLVTREISTDNGLTVYHVVAEGKVSELPIQWHYYLAQDDAGHRAGFVFTLEPKLLEKLQGSDLAIVRSLKFVDGGTVQTSVK